MSPEPITHLSIDGKRITSFTSIKLEQKTNDHHQFEIILDNDFIEVIGGHTIDKSKDWLGKSLIITFDEIEFLGYITAVNLENKDGHNGNLILNGYSPTILLEGGSSMYSWVNNTLEAIVNQTLETLNIGTEINPVFKEAIKYQVQYNENNYQFLQRLAKQYNEWFYYNGTKILFGKPKLGEVVRIEYGREISEIRLEIKVNDHSQTKYSYNSRMNSLVASTSKDQVEGLNELGSHAFHTSAEIYKPKKNSFTHIDTQMKYQIDDLVARKQATASAGLHVMKAKSNKQGLTVGTIIKVESAKVASSETNGKSTFKIQNYGEYMITSITHEATERSEYFNTFEAIPSGIAVPEEPNIALPKAETQIATVISNEDPKGIGRVQVKFDWQINNLKTAWLRVMTPDAGSSKQHSKNRGHVFIPEIDDQVMVGFEYNDPNRPFVLGSMFHGDNGAGGSANNNIKSIITKSGNEIIFNDGDGKGSIKVNAPKGNSVHLNGDGSIAVFDASGNKMYLDNNGNIDVTAPNHITFNSKKVTFNVMDKMQLNVLQKMFVNTPFLQQFISTYYHTQAGKALFTSENEIKIESPELYAVGQKKLYLHSDELATLNSKGIAELKGEKGNKHTNVAEEYQIVAPEVEAKAVINFRPHSAWTGEFGFDWMRVVDTSIAGDVNYKTNVGRYTGLDASGKVIYATKSGAVFTPSNYPALESEYNPINITGKTDASGNQIQYYTPWLSIYRKPNIATPPSAEIELQVEVEIAPDEIYIEYPKKYFEVAGAIESPVDKNLMQVKLPASTHTVTNPPIIGLIAVPAPTITPNKTNITIKCIHTLEQDRFITAYVIKNKADGTAGEPKLAGRLKVKANNKAKRRVAKIVFINVITDVNAAGGGVDGISPADKIAKENALTPFLRQALVSPKVVNEDLMLFDSTKANTQSLNRNYTIGSVGSKLFNLSHNTGGTSLADFLLAQFNSTPINSIYNNHYKVFFFGERGAYLDGTRVADVNGYANGLNSKECVMFNTANSATTTHELMHCMGLSHSFDNNSTHVFKIGQTENIMDYSHQSKYGSIDRISTWEFQWETLIKNNQKEP